MKVKRLSKDMRSVRLWDISRDVDESTSVYPGDTPFTQKWLTEETVKTSEVKFTPHVGTHVDGPLHFSFGTHGIGSADLRAFVGLCRVVRIASKQQTIREEDLPEDVWNYPRILFAAQHPSQGVGKALAEKLAESGVLLVGIDTPSADPEPSECYGAHETLLGKGVYLLENLDLSAVEDGVYFLSAAPLKWKNAEASPVRAYLLEMPEDCPQIKCC
jgi:arylformamidase